jgi:DNA-binding transcriptional ArsR family regulator
MQQLDVLREAGLTTYQSKAYLELKSEGGLTPTEIAQRSGVPQGKIYETLYSLEVLRLVKRHLNKEKAAEVDRQINEFLTDMKRHRISLKVFGRGRLKQVWSTNGVSLTSLVDKGIKDFQRTRRRVARYESTTDAIHS